MTPLGVLYVPIWSRAIICSSGFSVRNMFITHPFTFVALCDEETICLYFRETNSELTHSFQDWLAYVMGDDFSP